MTTTKHVCPDCHQPVAEIDHADTNDVRFRALNADTAGQRTHRAQALRVTRAILDAARALTEF